MRHSQVILSALTSAMLASAVPAIAAAQPTPADATATSAPAADAKEIVVTAQRRSENIQNVNIAITALSANALDEKRVVRPLDLQNAAPGLSIVKSGLTESINIRGIGLASGSPQVTNGVSTYLDGVFQPPIVSSSQFYDISGIEVLRGPQGTLVGANSTGGAIYINTNKPVLDQFGGSVALSGGSYHNLGADVAANVPIGDTLAIRFAGLDNTRRSYYKDAGPAHTTPDKLDEQDGRVQVLWKPGHFQALAKAEFISRDTGGYAYQPIATSQYTAGRTAMPWTVDYNTPTANNEQALLTNLELKYVFDSGLTLRSQTAYLNKRVNNIYDVDGTGLATVPPAPGSTLGTASGLLGQNQFVREREYSQELNIISPDTGKFKYVIGGYAQRNKINVRIVNTTTNATTGVAAPTLYIEPDTDKLLLGVFGQASYQLTDQFQVEAGLRYSHFHVDGTGGVYVGRTATSIGINVSPQTGTEGDGQMTGKLALNFKPDTNNLFYAFVAHGYKNGGINPPGGTFRPETVWDYEGGWKSSFMDRHIRTQIGAFYNSYKNFQEDIINQASGSSGVTNLANATIYGAEASAQIHAGAFSADGGVSYVRSKLSGTTLIGKFLVPSAVSGFPQCTGANAARCFDYGTAIVTTSSGPNLYSPRWTWNVGAQYRFDLGGGFALTPRGNYAYVGSQFAYPTYVPATDLINAHGLVSASLALTKDRVRLEFYGTNLANRFYVAGQTGKNEFYGAPREFGLKLSASF